MGTPSDEQSATRFGELVKNKSRQFSPLVDFVIYCYIKMETSVFLMMMTIIAEMHVCFPTQKSKRQVGIVG